MKEEKTLLDDLKKLEEVKKKKVLAKILNKIKEDAEEILKLKTSYEIYMEELGVDKKEAKRIIDWINSLVKITKKDKEELREEIREELKENKKTVEKKLEEAPYYNLGTLTNNCGTNVATFAVSDATTTTNIAGNTATYGANSIEVT